MARKKPPKDDAATKARGFLVGVYGPFGSRALVEVPRSVAEDLIGEKLVDPAPVRIVEAARKDIESLRARDAELADSALAESVVSLAVEMASPGASATAKSMCARAMADALKQLRELAPPVEPEADRIDEVNKKREERRRRRRAGA